MSLYHSEQERLILARNIVEESVVLLKNESWLLPLSSGMVAFFGRACYKPNLGGMGSGDSTSGKKMTPFDVACEAEKLIPARGLQEFYQKVILQEKEETLMDKIKALGTDLIASGIIYELFGEYQYHAQPQEPAAVARILSGAVSPSGKLAFTMAMSYEDYPTADTFSYDKDDPDSIKEYKHYGLSAEDNGSIGFEKSPVTLYREGLYMGYRYFDSFGKEVAYPFGFGLSYAAFGISDVSVR